MSLNERILFRKLRKNKEYQLKNRDKIFARKKIYSNNRYKTVNNYRLICKTIDRFRQVLRTISKSCSTIDILGIDLDIYRKWIEY